MAGGSGDRLGLGTPKAFVEIAGRSILSIAVENVSQAPEISSIVVVVPSGSEEIARTLLAELPAVTVVAGGVSRHASVAAGLSAVEPLPDRVVVHDAARPFASPKLFAAVLDALDGWDGVVPVLPPADTVKRVRDGAVVATELREELGLAQTPQAFRGWALLEAHHRATEAGRAFTDDAACLEWAGFRVCVVEGEPANFKITTVEDLRRAGVADRGRT